MKIEEFDYYLPEELIAQTPLEDRSSSRLLVMDRATGHIVHHQFKDIVSYLGKGDVLVLNDTKVVPSRLYGKKTDTLANIEVLLLKEIQKDTYECLVRPFRRVKEGTTIKFSDKLECTILKKVEEGIVIASFKYKGIFLERLDEIGEMPLPPYIHEKLEDKSRYQTVYAKHVGSAAAPTAGFHFTKELLSSLEAKGVDICYVTLHVGLGTFRPVQEENVEEHKMHSEEYEITKEVANKLNKAKEEHKRIVCVGTTSMRTLEANMTKYKTFTPTKEETNIFIYPGYEFKGVDALITNFHLPKSTLLMLVSAFSSKEKIMAAYKEAVDMKYRFFSFGDAMFLK